MSREEMVILDLLKEDSTVEKSQATMTGLSFSSRTFK